MRPGRSLRNKTLPFHGRTSGRDVPLAVLAPSARPVLPAARPIRRPPRVRGDNSKVPAHRVGQHEITRPMPFPVLAELDMSVETSADVSGKAAGVFRPRWRARAARVARQEKSMQKLSLIDVTLLPSKTAGSRCPPVLRETLSGNVQNIPSWVRTKPHEIQHASRVLLRRQVGTQVFTSKEIF